MSEAQLAEVTRLKQYFPFRICFGALSPAGEFLASAATTMRKPNDLMRKGWKVWTVTL